MEYAKDPFLFPLLREPASRWERAGLTPEQERTFNRIAAGLVTAFLVGWIYVIFLAPREHLPPAAAPVARVSSALTRSPLAVDAPSEPAFVIDQLVRTLAYDIEEEVGGVSGAVNVQVLEPGDTLALPAAAQALPQEADLVLAPAEDTPGAPRPASQPPNEPGIWNVMLRMRNAIRPTTDTRVITLTPLSERRGGRIGRYLIGEWPYEEGGAPKPIYRAPAGLVRVTPQNQNVWISEHVQLKDFLTKGQTEVWPKYVALQPRVLDKLELTLQELERSGIPVENIFVVSAFRTPVYNATGGNTGGRGKLSRHMYGDAMDFAIDNDRDGRMDDLNDDGRVNVEDARVLAQAAERVEKRYPHLVGGIGIYRPTGAHSGFVHVDTRGFRSRWGAW